MSKFIQGKYKVKNPTKYVGDISNVIYRSSYELKAMNWFDQNPNVIKWGSEEFAVPYISPIDNKQHRYFPDFIIQAKQADNSIKTFMIEVKPSIQTIAPKQRNIKTSKQRQRFISECKTWAINSKKWKIAEEFCNKHQWEFKILTEKDLNIKK